MQRELCRRRRADDVHPEEKADKLQNRDEFDLIDLVKCTAFDQLDEEELDGYGKTKVRSLGGLSC